MKTKALFSSILSPPKDDYWNHSKITEGTAYVLEVEKPEAIVVGSKIAVKIDEKAGNNIKSMSEVEEIVGLARHEGATFCGFLTVVGRTVYISSFGEGACYVKRGEQTAKLLSGTGSISGTCQAGDNYFLASGKLISTLGEKEALSSFDNLLPQEMGERLTIDLHKHENPLGAGIIYRIMDFVEEDYISSTNKTFETAYKYRESLARKIFYKGMRAIKERRIPGLWRVRRKIHRVKSEPVAVYASVAVILVGIFLISVVLGVRRDMNEKRNHKYQDKITEVRSFFEEAIALRDLNPVKSREMISQASTLAEQAVKDIPDKTKEGREIAKLATDIRENFPQILKIISEEPKIYYDIELLKKGSQATDISIWQDRLAIMDANLKSVYAIELMDKNAGIAGGGEGISDFKNFTAGLNSIYILSSDGVYLLSRGESKKIITASKEWGNIKDIQFFGSNLYLLDSVKNRIWKYQGQENGFSDIKEYLAPDTLVDFSRANSLSIDGSIYVSFSEGKVSKFIQGREETHIPEGVTLPLGQNLRIFTDDTVVNNYILDSDNKRVVVVDKDGKYVAQYVWKGDLSPSNIAVSEKHKLIILLINGLLYSLDLR